MATSSTSVDVAAVGADPYGLSLAAHLRARVEYQIFGSWKSWKNNMPGAKLGELQGLVLGWTFDLGIEGACAALVLAFATKLDSAAGPAHEGRAQSPLQT